MAVDAFTLVRQFEILLVEDSLSDAKLVAKALDGAKRQTKLRTVSDGEQAVAFLKDAKGEALPDLIILDLNLPRKDGWEVLSECKGDERLREIPIVVFTTTQMARDVQRCYAMGANSFVAKPFELQPFLKAIQAIEEYWLSLSASYRG